METMRDFLEQIRKRYNLKSEAELAKYIGITPQALHQHKTARSKHFSEATAFNIARLLNLNPAYVLLCLRVEAADNRATKTVWMGMLEKVERYAAAVLVAVFVAFQPQPAQAGVFNITLSPYTLNALSWLYGLLRRLYGGFQACLGGNVVPTTNNKKRGVKWNLAN